MAEQAPLPDDDEDEFKWEIKKRHFLNTGRSVTLFINNLNDKLR